MAREHQERGGGVSLDLRASPGVDPVWIIAIAELFGSSLWFSANSATDDLIRAWNLGASEIGWLTNAVQLGFILGTLFIALSGLADRVSAAKVFVGGALVGALCNALFALTSDGMLSGLFLRFLVGVCLAGIYPLGMKLIVSWAPDRAGTALSLLVGMLVLGTALPHLSRLLGAEVSWRWAILASSVLAVFAAGLVGGLGEGPHLRHARKATGAPRLEVITAFGVPRFRAAALGYFGHMWELYAFWTLLPLLVGRAVDDPALAWLGVSGLSFAVIAIGAFGCFLGGMVSRRVGGARVAAAALSMSGLSCLLFALFADTLPPLGLALLLLVWGMSIPADSPQFSALSAKACPPHMVGGALAIQNAIGFIITVVAIAVTTALVSSLGASVAWVLLPGPILGLIGCYPLWK
ncbi:MAG: MFS transporter [Rhodospirillum sp.]|nr:MFS transporter [Rhodospirillum sp.]MCF8487775.1 MFS transporter [Rhodospirillum sp.]MCF8502856.1 MFS transporter [Rhodospirillum sp.]